MSHAAIASIERVETALDQAGWSGRRLRARHGVVTMAPVVPSGDNLERLAGAWRFDEPSQGWAADGCQK